MDHGACSGKAVMLTRRIKFWLHACGAALGVLGVVFVGVRLYGHAGELDFWSRFGGMESLVLVVLAILYGASNALLARAWWCQLDFFEVKANWSWALKAYGLSQLAKYVPGNIFHLAGRQALGMAAGFPARQLAKSAAWEVGSIVVAGGPFGVLVMPLLWPGVSYWVALLVFGLVLLGVRTLARRAFSLAVADAVLWQAGFLVLSGLIFVAALALLMDTPMSWGLVLPVCGAYVVAWLVGLVTPGAPAGVGVREMVLLFLLNGQVGPDVLLLAVVLGRLVTVAGDFLFFAAMVTTPRLRKALE